MYQYDRKVYILSIPNGVSPLLGVEVMGKGGEPRLGKKEGAT
jgi:hypothetical protein